VLTADDGGDGGIVDAPPIDLDSITSERLEEVVAANPDVVPMRLLLAGMLLEEGEVLAAAQHYGEVLQREEHPEALAGLGWISFLVDEHATAQEYLTEALEIQPNFPQAQWWLANVRLIGLGDAAGAIEPLEALLASGAAPDDVRVLAEDMLEQARSSL
jgi:cytochrome c-type biogenesis protein CcmH/NrfG